MGFFKKVGRGIKRGANTFGRNVKKRTRNVVRAGKVVAKTVDRATDPFERKVKRTTQNIGKGLQTAGRNIGKGTQTALRETGDFLKDRGEDIAKVGRTAGNLAKEGFEEVGEFAENVGDFIDDRRSDVRKGVKRGIQRVDPLTGGRLSDFADAVEDAGDEIKDFAEGAIDKAEDVVGPVAHAAGQSLKKLAEEAGEIAEKVGDVGAAMLNKLANLSPNVRRCREEIEEHADILADMLDPLAELQQDSEAKRDLVDETLRPIFDGRLRGAAARDQIGAVSEMPIIKSMGNVGRIRHPDWPINHTLGMVVDVQGIAIGGQMGVGWVLHSPKKYFSPSWSLGAAAGASVDLQYGLFIRPIDQLAGRFVSFELDLHIPNPKAAMIPMGASVSLVFDPPEGGIGNLKELWDRPESYIQVGRLQGFVLSGGIGKGIEFFNRGSGETKISAI
ncbi:MAG: hypothetical protein AAGK00_18800 [Pseudomonadota bacterium]